MDMTLDELIALRKINEPDKEISECPLENSYEKDRGLVDCIDLDYLTDEDICIGENLDFVDMTTQSNSTNDIVDLREKITGNVPPLIQSSSLNLNVEQDSMSTLCNTTPVYNLPSKRNRRNKRRNNRHNYGKSRQKFPRKGNNKVRDLVIQIDSRDVNTHTKRTDFSKEAIGQGAVQTDSSNSDQICRTEMLSNLLQLDNNIKKDLLPMLAEKFLKLLENNEQSTIHKPVYDLELQKEIHSLQNKTMRFLHKGQIISEDGKGINTCRITPTAGKVSLNYRFT